MAPQNQFGFEPFGFEPIQNDFGFQGFGFEPIKPTPSKPQEPADFFSRSLEGIRGFGGFLGNALLAGLNPGSGLAAVKSQEIGSGAVEPLRDFGRGNVGRGLLGIIGANPDTVEQDWNESNYGALLGDFMLPAALGLATRGARVMGPRIAGKAPIAAPKAALPIAPETPRFYSGVAGVADTRMNYPHELGPASNVSTRASSTVSTPSFTQGRNINPIVRDATILPGESLHPIVPDIGAELAAGRTGSSGAPFSHPMNLLKPEPVPGFRPEPKTAFKPEFTDQFISPGRITDPTRLLTGATQKIARGQKITPDEFRSVVDDSIARTPAATNLAEAMNLSRGIMATDLTPMSSSMFRQAFPLIGTKAWWGALDDMTVAWGSEKAYQIGKKGIDADPIIPYADEVGLKRTKLDGLTSREEAIASTWSEKIPVVGKQVVRRSNRSFDLSLDKIRVDHLKNLVNKAEDLGLQPKQNLVLGRQIAEFINNATGRGSLGKLEKFAGPLNTALFSPRNFISRVKMLDPKNYLPWMDKVDPRAYIQSNYTAIHPFVRKQYWHSLGSMIGAWGAMRELAVLGGASAPIDDPTNSDFGKIVIGDTRIDPGAGFLQEIVLASRLFSGKTTSSVSGQETQLNSRYGGPNYMNVPGQFLANKLSPVFSYAYDWATQTPSIPFRPREEAIERMLPMIVGDILEINLENPGLFPLPFDVNKDLGSMTGMASFLGLGTQTYQPRLGGNVRFIRP